MERITIIYDLETTGFKCMPTFSHYHKIIQICAQCLETGAHFESFVNPGFKGEIPPASTKVHNITREDVKDAEQIDVVLRKMYDFFEFEKYNTVEMIAHNNDQFDKLVIMKEYKNLGIDEVPANVSFWDTLPWLRSNYPGLGMGNYNLEKLYMYFFTEAIANAHRADADVAALVRIYKEKIAPTRVVDQETEKDILFNLVYNECLTSVRSIGPGRANLLYTKANVQTVSGLKEFANEFLLKGDPKGFDHFLKTKIYIGNVTARMNVIATVYEIPVWFDQIFDYMTLERTDEDCLDAVDYYVKYKYVLNEPAPKQQIYNRGMIKVYQQDDW